MSFFSPYREWLGIHDAQAAPNHYRLLGLRLFEDDLAVISAAAVRLSHMIQGQLNGPYGIDARRVLSEIETARSCLMTPTAKAAYDAMLRQQLSVAPLNPLAGPDAGAADSLLPPTAMSWQSGAAASPAVGAMPMPPQPMPPGHWHTPGPMQPSLPGSPTSLPAGAMPGATPSQSVPLPPAGQPASYSTSGYAPMPPSPASFGSMNYSQTASPAAFAPPAAIPLPPAQPPMAAMAIPMATPVTAPVAMATPVYAASVYTPPAAVPVSQPVAVAPQAIGSHAEVAAPTTVVAPNMRVAWRRRKPNTPAIALAATTGVLIVAAVVVVAANRPNAEPAKPPIRQVAQEPRLFNLPVEPSPRESVNKRPATKALESPERPAANRPTAMEDKPLAMSNTPAAPAMPEPAKPAPPVPAPITPAPPAAMSDAKKDEAVTSALNLARISLGKIDIATARKHIATARAAEAANRSDEIDRVDVLAKYMEDFWNGVNKGIENLVIGGQLAIKDSFVGVVEVQSGILILRVQGQNKTYDRANLPPGIALALAESWLRKEDAATKIILGTYQAMHPLGDRGKARDLWQAAAGEGAKVAAEQLLAELDVPLPNPDAMPALADLKPGADGRLATPGATAQTQARGEVRQMFEADFAEAKDAATKGALAAKLLERAEKPSDPPAVRYILLAEAGKLAAEAGDFDRMTTAFDQLAEQFAADAIELKADTLFEAAKATTGAEANQALANAALAICDEAVLSDKIDEALKIARTAQAAARKASDPDLVKLCVTREKEVRELKK